MLEIIVLLLLHVAKTLNVYCDIISGHAHKHAKLHLSKI